jgi:phenylacetaldehyde dehydrogenase
VAATDRLSTRTCYSAAHKSVNDKVVEGMVNKAGKIKVGHGLDGPLVSKEQHSKVAGYIESGRKEGVKVETGGGVIGNQGYFVEPTLLTKTNRGMRVVREEIFGPVVCVQSFDDDDLDQVAKFANDTEYGLQASIWTQNLKVAHSLARKIKAGTICVNTHNYGDPAWPFGGFKQSGWSRDGQGSDGALHRDQVGRHQHRLRTGVRCGR